MFIAFRFYFVRGHCIKIFIWFRCGSIVQQTFSYISKNVSWYGC